MDRSSFPIKAPAGAPTPRPGPSCVWTTCPRSGRAEGVPDGTRWHTVAAARRDEANRPESGSTLRYLNLER